MGKQTLPARSRYGWRWFLILLGGVSWLSIGCNPQSLSMLLMPFNGENSVEPEYKLFVKDKEITVAILSNFARPQTHPDLQAADAELAEQVASAFRKRCAENKNKIKIVPFAQVRSQQVNQQLIGGDSSPIEIGKKLKADYVLDLTINSFSLYEKNYHPPMYRGNANIAVNLYKVEVKDDVHKMFTKEYPRIFPGGSGPIDASSTTPTAFRSAFMVRVADDIAKLFIAYSPDEKHRME